MKTEKLNNHIGEIPCIDPVAQAEFEQNKLLKESVIELLKGRTYLQANGILESCLWDIKQRAVIS